MRNNRPPADLCPGFSPNEPVKPRLISEEETIYARYIYTLVLLDEVNGEMPRAQSRMEELSESARADRAKLESLRNVLRTVPDHEARSRAAEKILRSVEEKTAQIREALFQSAECGFLSLGRSEADLKCMKLVDEIMSDGEEYLRKIKCCLQRAEKIETMLANDRIEKHKAELKNLLGK